MNVEAMKIKHSFVASAGGSAKVVNYVLGQQVADGEELIVLEEGL
jgi:biotin carboxyl carrier protein